MNAFGSSTVLKKQTSSHTGTRSINQKFKCTANKYKNLKIASCKEKTEIKIKFAIKFKIFHFQRMKPDLNAFQNPLLLHQLTTVRSV